MKKEELLKRLESHQPDILGMPNTREHAVILPVIEKAEDLHILFEVRSQRMRRQPGEVCFPGGKIDSGETPQEAALREMWRNRDPSGRGVICTETWHGHDPIWR